MDAVFHPAVSTGVPRNLNLAVEQRIPCLAGGPTTFHTELPAGEVRTKNQAT